MDATVVRALTKIAADCYRKQGALKKQCNETLGELFSTHPVNLACSIDTTCASCDDCSRRSWYDCCTAGN